MRKLSILAILFCFAIGVRAQSILSESFNVSTTTSTPPTGWTVSSSGSTNGCFGTDINQVVSGGFVCSTSPQPNPSPHSGSGMGGYNSWDIYAGGYSELVSPSLNFSSLGTNTFSIWVYNQQAYYGDDSIRFYVNTSPTSAGGYLLDAMVPNYSPPTTGWTLYSYNIPTTFTGTTNYIIIRCVSDYGYDILFDDVDVTHNPPTPCTGTPAAPSISNTAYNPASPLCSGSSVTLNGVDPNFPTIGGLTYQWQYASSSTGPWTNVSFGTGANTRFYNTGSLSTSYYFRMTTTCTASSATSASAAFFVPIGAPQPGFLSGRLNFCPGDTATYSVPYVAGTSYTWTLPSGWSGTSSTNSILVTPATNPGTISVQANNSCGTSIAQSRSIVAGSAPAAPSSIGGNSNVCGNSSQTYTISPVTGALTYAWTFPPSWTTSGATNGTNIMATASNFSGNIIATAINGCGVGRDTLAVVVVNSLPHPGTITGNNKPCSGTLNTYSINPVPGATSYTWYLPNGWSGTTTGTSIQAYPGTSTGSLKVTAFSTCATSPTDSLNIAPIQSVTPSVSLSSSTGTFCQGALMTFTATTSNGGTTPQYFWSKNGNAILNSGAGYITNTLATGDQIGVTLVSDAVCRTKDSATALFITPTIVPSAHPGINIDETPGLNKCSGTLRYFTSTIKDGGTSPLYQWYINGAPVAATNSNTFSSSTLNNADTITAQLTSNAQCPTSASVISNKQGVDVFPSVVPSVSVVASNNDVSAGPVIINSSETGGGTNATYQWYLNGVQLAAETNANLSSSSFHTGDHIFVEMYSYDPCANPKLVSSNEIILTGPAGIGTTKNWTGTLQLYPNPNNGNFSIQAKGGTTQDQVQLEVFNLVGQRIYQYSFHPEKANWTKSFTLPNTVANGLYSIRLSSGAQNAMLPFTILK